MKCAEVSLVVGDQGQDGHYLSALLRARGSHVIGIGRTRAVSSRLGDLGAADVRDRARVGRLLADLQPGEIYYLAGVFGSSESAAEDRYQEFQRCGEVHIGGWLNFLDAVERQQLGARLFYAASSRVFGHPSSTPQNELTPHAPLCMYGITKSAGMRLCNFYRGRGIHCSSGILYNHESPRRPESFVSRKIVQAAVDIKLGSERTLAVGNLSAAVDWGAAQDYVDAMARILRLEQAGDFVIASDQLHTVRQFVETAFAAVELAWEPHVIEDRTLLKALPSSQALVGDSRRLREATGWRPRFAFGDMVRHMVDAELQSRQPAPA